MSHLQRAVADLSYEDHPRRPCPPPPHPRAGRRLNDEIGQYATDKALSNIKLTLIYYQDNDVVLKGEPKLSPKVTAIQAEVQPYTATITDCEDTGSYIEVDRKTGKPLAVTSSSRRHRVTSTAPTIGGTWMIMDTTIDREATC